MNTLTFQKNDVIFRQGEFADTMYKLLSGSIRIVSDYGKESEKEIAVLKDGDFFGEMGLVECYPRSATAVVSSEAAEVTEFELADCKRFFNEDPEGVMKILRQLADRIKETDQAYLNAVETVKKAKAVVAGNEKPSEESKSALRRLREYYLSFLGE